MKFDGNKTYIIAALIIVAGVLNAFDVLNTELLMTVVSVLLGGGLASLRHSVAKVNGAK